MHPILWSFTPADDDTNGIANGLTGAGPYVLTANDAGDDLSHIISLTSTADLSGLTVTVTGLDPDGNSISEDITGPNNTTVYGTLYFSSVTEVTVSATLGANTMDVGWKDTCVSASLPLNWRQVNFQVSVSVDISGTINWTIQHTFDTLLDGAPYTWWNHDTLAAQTADAQGNYAFAVTATRLLISSLSAGATADFRVVQGR